ncbi:4-diphosphocytidyl-2-C-methyl-D-erythritol kinase [Sphingomonas naasensis]|uniref:4-diphosphocytidyl-2-C-methyl-D-erythritol kinase n=1 Tax=Sphingomonas naasensis TaxID=1344951 RepID=A0A4S1WR41_9SPHN|nr:4-(cytidine 5'-diphospho)-2-C-methyl-D-erythritol kinase [Sphingomonas naasensis]NIJ18579.1 4-diphosphocytidyl-2-C-methyl-D-erythritol kinase [Sphingomonas naasensis]TGX45829.1 4-(cytidine 5'-diphospho)-2-C-methyl-D-erythritol kinase [Sphingomonas naasensis]
MLTEIARAKLNLALHVRARRPDGYHELETLFAFVEQGDVLRLAPADTPRFRVTGPFAAALAGEGDNLVTRAAARFAESFGGGAHAIELEKHLPVASGIGGGSADAAAALRALARLHIVPLDDPGLFAIADALGSDVPACLLGKTAIGKGRGEQLQPVTGMPGTPVLLVNPGVAVSTAEVFRRWDGVDRGPLGGDPLAGRNDLEAPALAIAPVIGEVLAALAAQPGVTLARMSGSGATCFALFETVEACAAAAVAVARPGWWSAETRLV